ncbi:unnamed protein product [Phytophthora lilii]|uniref:Unnamed protein product n=1 Tax=Phytophthora lilii TaxID=2077276 RepID=A0A9W6YJ07_9STRA|nr:unnamed protein product [Phytophthora lilii]
MTAMTRQRGQQATYDQMMAELQLDSDEDERETKYSEPWQDRRKYDALESRRRATMPMPSPKPDEKVRCSPRREDQRSDAKISEETKEDDPTKKRRLSFPSSNGKTPSRRGSSSFSRSHNSEGNFPNDSDDSDQEREGKSVNLAMLPCTLWRLTVPLTIAAPVINASRELFGAKSASVNDTGFAKGPKRSQIDALRALVMRAPAHGAAAIRVSQELEKTLT